MTLPSPLPPPYEFTQRERELVISLSQKLTGSTPSTQPKMDACLTNVARRMLATDSASLREYLHKLDTSVEELSHFISAVTIHTTSWFRELPHFDQLPYFANAHLNKTEKNSRATPLHLLSAACSTGEEAYSVALVLEEMRQKHAQFDYRIEGFDIDPISVAKANQAIFSLQARQEIPKRYHSQLYIGSGKTAGFFTLDREIRARCRFFRRNLFGGKPIANQRYDIIFCRNALIYFSAEAMKEIIKDLISLLNPAGILCVGHSESIDAKSFHLSPLGNATYRKEAVLPKLAQKQKLKRPNLILVGASTGGTEVLISLLRDMPRPCPPIIVVQHIALSFAKTFALRLAKSAGLTLGQPSQGEPLRTDHLYMAWEDIHIGVRHRGHTFYLELNRDPPIHSVRPSVDHLFFSASKLPREAHIAAVLLTGMGKDGAQGLSELRRRDAQTFVQDEESSTVFGMPREAILKGAAVFIGNPAKIREQLLELISLES